MYPGGLSYVSSGPAVCGFHIGDCPEAVATAVTNAIKVSCRSRLPVFVPSQPHKGVSTRLGRFVARQDCIRLGVISESVQFTACNTCASCPTDVEPVWDAVLGSV